jgi:phosphopantothenoylcysteine decarboxylase/phosphopantothenate--cysteine ligase
MYLHPATQANLELLSSRGVTVIPPGEGELASHGEHGIGRLAEPEQLLAVCEALMTPATLRGVGVLVTAGGTREPIDSVRFIGNRSSGRMGFALAAEAARRGASVTLIAANVALEPPPGAEVITVQTAAELAEACEREFERCDALLMAAAVADFRPTSPESSKIKKDRGVPNIEIEPTADVLSGLAARRTHGQVLVGFAAEHGPQALSYARGKLERKGLDAVVVNDISNPQIGFEVGENEVTILATDGGERHVEKTSKELVARAVLDELERLRITSREGAGGITREGAGSAAGI